MIVIYPVFSPYIIQLFFTAFTFSSGTGFLKPYKSKLQNLSLQNVPVIPTKKTVLETRIKLCEWGGSIAIS